MRLNRSRMDRCLYASVGAPNPQGDIQQALDALVAQSLLSVSENTGYKLQSSAGQEWQRERDAYACTGSAPTRALRSPQRLRLAAPTLRTDQAVVCPLATARSPGPR